MKLSTLLSSQQDLHIPMDGQQAQYGQYQHHQQQYYYRPPSILSQDQISPDSQIAPTPPGPPPPAEINKQASTELFFSFFHFHQRKYFSILCSESQQLFLNID